MPPVCFLLPLQRVKKKVGFACISQRRTRVFLAMCRYTGLLVMANADARLEISEEEYVISERLRSPGGSSKNEVRLWRRA